MTKALKSVLSVQNDLNTNLLERETAVEAALIGLLTGEHVLYLGPPGTAKSQLVRSICERVEKAVYFERLLTRFSTPEELFGPLSLAALEQDRYQRVTSGTLVEAHVAFLDEVFKANSAILNTLLSIMNERIFHENGKASQVPLLSLFAASNETPEEDCLTALYDRFLLRVIVSPLTSDDSMRNLFNMKASTPSAVLTGNNLRKAQNEVDKVVFTDETCEAIIAIKHNLEQEGLAVSDRRWKSCTKLVRAKAWLESETKTSVEHCETLTHALWTEPSQIRTVEKAVHKVANPLNLEAVELEDAAKDLFDQRPSPTAENFTQALEPIMRQISDIHTRLEHRISSESNSRTRRAEEALAKVNGWHRELSRLALQSLSMLHMAPGSA